MMGSSVNAMRRSWRFFIASLLLTSVSAIAQNDRFDDLRQQFKTAPTDSLRLVFLDELSYSFVQQNFDSSVYYAGLQKGLAQAAHDSVMLAYAYKNYGRAFEEQGELDSAIRYIEKALTIEKASHNQSGMAGSYHNIGLVYDRLGNMNLAMEYYLKALEIKEKLGNPVALSSTVSAIGFVYKAQDQHQKSLEQFQKALDLLIEGGGSSNRIRGAYNNIGLAYMNLKEYDSARSYYRRSVAGLKEDDNLRGFGAFYNNMGVTYDENLQFDSALYYYTQSLRVKSRSGDKYGVSSTNHNLAVNYRRGGFPEKAIPHERASIALAKQYKFLELRMKSTDGLRESFAATNQIDSAYFYTLVWKELSDSLQRIERGETVMELEAKYESEKKDKELALNQATLAQQQSSLRSEARLRYLLLGGLVLLTVFLVYAYRSERVKSKSNTLLQQKNQEIEEKSLELARSLGEKEALLKEIHHRVKNNLQVISSILNMQSRTTASPEMISAIQEGQSRVKAMALIHQKLYQTEKLSEIDFREYAEELVQYLSTVFSQSGQAGIVNKVTGSNIKLDIDLAIPLGLILNELISNAYKYAFEGMLGGEISIELTRTADGQLQLAVGDNGNGLPHDFSIDKVKSLGLKLVNILTRQLNGQLSFHSVKGAHFSIVLHEDGLTT
ncbi:MULTISPECIES: tetratricopeptide repeat protein [unclassified Imperialibacter]|uniref:tetratricopeptide repeat-containing sensor histidine kinase n=1 Tax=unclassified Imperialibacter TaxID=2629706 RepID=UPI00125FE5E1|nr:MULTISPECIES: tetratricopeptide repeat protein [unclassified Imperialibacter]